tara:strand:- start:1169 stop:1441 length:273 start_codon:yes stop_codon:yes gene_type:complete
MSNDIKISIDEVLELVTFTRDSEGRLRIVNVGDVDGDVVGKVGGSVIGDIQGDVVGDVVGDVHGSVYGSVIGYVRRNVYGGIGGKSAWLR